MTSDAKKKGGARQGAGRKKREAPVEIIDGRSVGGKDYAQQLIDELNTIDPQIMEDCELRVSVDPWVIPENATDEQHKDLEKLETQRKITLAAKIAADSKFEKLRYEVQGWAKLWFSPRTALETRRYLYDKAKGKAVITVNHLHDKPIQHEVSISMAEVVRKVRERKQNYERSRS